MVLGASANFRSKDLTLIFVVIEEPSQKYSNLRAAVVATFRDIGIKASTDAF